MRSAVIGAGLLVGGLAGLCGSALLAEGMRVAGREITVTDDGMGSAALVVDGAVLHENGVIYMDDAPQVVDGVTVLTGAAGAGGNACNAAPVVLALPESGPPEFWGPVESCAYFTPRVDGGRIVFAADALPGTPGETWVWTPGAGFAPGPAVGFASNGGWEGFDSLAGAHPVDALALIPVLDRLQAGLGAEFPDYARLIGGIGAGNLTSEGYLGSACDKPTCDTDWAILYLHRETQGVFAIWQTYDDASPQIWPVDRSLWPPEALALVDWSTP
ncbi:hypothetical protein [Tabrizicola aquatica]|uniref:hypothetical protein n=1 Tax=Tabrizicola aquatica TaxID=909926 RepID=UPI0011AEDC21|nr:hypothetical protein [Tabrizicola aquatica]